jgi:FkbM family methyltransferase
MPNQRDNAMALSYTQNMEDYHLSLAFAGQQSGTYIDIGAGHPVADNVSFWFYERGWCGIVVEPQPHLAALYARVRPRDTAVCSLIGEQTGTTDFHVFDRFHGLSTTVAEHAVKSGAGFRTVKLPVITLAQLCADHVNGPIDFLKVDVEGAEASVLFGGDWQRYRPQVVVIEAVAPLSGEPSWEAWEPFLLAQGYRFVMFDTLNRFYVAEEATAVGARLPRERAPWDAVQHMYEIGRAPENTSHPDHALTRTLARGFWAMLPDLDRTVLAEIIARGTSPGEAALTERELDTDEFRAKLGRIACGYDGGQVTDDEA